jgi:hypothetical protein
MSYHWEDGNVIVWKIRKILDPSRGGVNYPYLHRIFHERMPDMSEPLSRCFHLFKIEPAPWPREEHTGPNAASHDLVFQANFASSRDGWQWINPPNERPRGAQGQPAHYLDGNNTCSELTGRLHFYGEIGKGSEYSSHCL